MKATLFSVVFLVGLAIIGNGASVAQPFIAWERSFSASSVSVTLGAVYAAGGSEVRRYDLNGTLIWSDHFDSSVSAIAADANGVYAVGSGPASNNGANATITRLNSDGGIVWSRILATFNDSDTASRASAVAVDSSGVYVAGYTLQFNRYPLYGWVMKTGLDGAESWIVRLEPIAITTGITPGAGAVYLSGYSRGCLGSDTADTCPINAYAVAVNHNGGIIWTREIPSTCTATTQSSSCDHSGAPQSYATGITADASGIYVSGSTEGVVLGQAATSSGAGASDAFVGRYSLNGTALWFRQYGTVFQNSAYAVSTSNGKLYVVGTDGLRQIDSNGNTVWLIKPDFTPRSLSASNTGIFLGGYTSIAKTCATPSCSDS